MLEGKKRSVQVSGQGGPCVSTGCGLVQALIAISPVSTGTIWEPLNYAC